MVWVFAFLFSLGLASPPLAIHFYRSTESLFPSGQERINELEKRKLREFQETLFRVHKDGKGYRISKNDILRDIDLCLRAANSKTGQTAWVLGSRASWLSTINAKGQRDWWALSESTAIPDDLGLAMNLNPISLRETPNWKAKALHGVINPTRFRWGRMEDQWIEVTSFTDPSMKGWVESSALVMKFDFAAFALPKGGSWVSVTHREANSLIGGDGRKIALDQIQAVMTRPDQGILTRTIDDLDLRQRSVVKVQTWETFQWNISRLPGHGEVFWRKSDVATKSSAALIHAPLTFDEILKKPIFSVAFHPKNPRLGIIAAEGIYLTEDGVHWRKLPQFNNDNLPVAISPDHEIFVGDQRSKDLGKTFNPYLKWEQITKIIEGSTRKTPRILRLTKIEPRNENRVLIEVDSGTKIKRFTGSTKFGLVTSWKSEASYEPSASSSARIRE